MTLGELKTSLTKFSSDMDEVEVLFTYRIEDKDKFECLGYIAYSELPNDGTVIILGTMSSAIERMKRGKLKDLQGNKLGNKVIDISKDDDNQLSDNDDENSAFGP